MMNDQTETNAELLEENALLKQRIQALEKSENILKESEYRFRVVRDISMEAFTILSCIRDAQGTITDFQWTYANPAAGRILKQQHEKLVGQRLLEVLPGNRENRDLFDRYVRIVETGQGDEVELEYRSGEISGWFRNMTVKLGDGVAISFSDITQRKQAEAILQQSKVELDRLVTERTAELSTAYAELQSKIAERKQTEFKLQEAEEKYRNIFENSAEGIYQVAPEGRFITANPAAAHILGYDSPEELIGTIKDIRAQIYAYPEDRDKATELLKKDGFFKNFEVRNRQKNGNIVWVMANVHVVRDDQGNVLYHEGTSRDITGPKRVEEALRESELKYRSLIEHSSYVVFCVDQNGEYKFVNQVFASTFGKTPDYFLGKTFWDIYPKEHADYRQAASSRVFATGESQSVEVVVPLPDRTLYYIAKANPVRDETGQVVLNLTHAIDITERKLAEDKLKASLREKEILLSEVHHRVKNNMQVISSLLYMQARSSGNPELTERLNESQSRIRSMALIHEKLYGSKDFTRIDLADYVRTLSQELLQSYRINPGEIDLIVQTEGGGVYVDIDKAIPCGLILNELISNALKHAFYGNEPCELRIIINEMKNKEIEIIVRDNGLGLPDDVDIHQPRTVGLYLVNGLIKNQLDGQIEVRRGGGTEFRIKFPYELSEGR